MEVVTKCIINNACVTICSFDALFHTEYWKAYESDGSIKLKSM